MITFPQTNFVLNEYNLEKYESKNESRNSTRNFRVYACPFKQLQCSPEQALSMHISEPHENLFLKVKNTIQNPEQNSEFFFIPVGMNDCARVEQVYNVPTVLLTTGLGPCIAAIGKCKLSDNSCLIGLTHIVTDINDFRGNRIQSEFEKNFKNVNLSSLIQRKQFKCKKLDKLIDQFLSHPSFENQKIELFLAGGNGNEFNSCWSKLLVEYAESIPSVIVAGTYLNPYKSTERIYKKLHSKDLKLSLMAGITNQGIPFFHKSHNLDFDFQTSTFNQLFHGVSQMFPD